jgi:hypothetical protein
MNIFTVGQELFSSERQTMTDRQTDRQTDVTAKKVAFPDITKALKEWQNY